MGKIIGIDLGTTNSAVAIYNSITEIAEIYENRATSQRTTPSVIALKKTAAKNGVPAHSEWVVGLNAKNQAATNPLNTFYGIKRLIGTRYDHERVAKMQAMASYEIVKNPKGDDAYVVVDGVPTSPQEICAKVLVEIKKQVEDATGEKITDAVITVPAYFDDTQRQATIDAGAIAGLNVRRIIAEPTAAALAYGMGKTEDAKIAVFDLGGGTFDVSILDIEHMDGENSIQVISNNGDTFLGGENFDEKITERLLEVLREQDGGIDIDLNDKASKKANAAALQKMRMAAERAKIALSTSESYDINEPFVGLNANNEPVTFEYAMTRTELNSLLGDLVRATLEPCKRALADAGLTVKDLNKIILVGGQTKMPLVVDTVRDFFGQEPSREVNPDEIVAMGASIQGAIIDGGIDNILLRDVIPLSIGIRTAGDVMKVMVPRNSPLPYTNKNDPNNESFTTSEDMQKDVNVQIYQGERAKASDNKYLGNLVLNIPPMKQGVPQIRIDIELDANGVMNVTATETVKNVKISSTLQTTSGLTDADIQRMTADAEKHAAADEEFRQIKATVASIAFDLTEAKKDETEEYFKTAPQELQDNFAKAFAELTTAKDSGDLAQMTEKKEALKAVRLAIGEAFGAAAAPAAEATNDNTTEAPAADATAPKTATPGGPGA